MCGSVWAYDYLQWLHNKQKEIWLKLGERRVIMAGWLERLRVKIKKIASVCTCVLWNSSISYANPERQRHTLKALMMTSVWFFVVLTMFGKACRLPRYLSVWYSFVFASVIEYSWEVQWQRVASDYSDKQYQLSGVSRRASRGVCLSSNRSKPHYSSDTNVLYL